MLGIHDLPLFILAGLLLNITPGPDMMYIIGRSTGQGLRAGAAATFGVSAGCFVHIAAAALGISALITASATAFAILKIVGAAYLIYVGVSLLKTNTGDRSLVPNQGTPGTDPGVLPFGTRDLSPVFWQGFLTNALNPKVALFFLAFLPQFIAVDAPMKPVAFLLLGAIFTVNATWWNLLVAWGAARMSSALGSRMIAWAERAIGAFFLVLGVRLLVEEAR